MLLKIHVTMLLKTVVKISQPQLLNQSTSVISESYPGEGLLSLKPPTLDPTLYAINPLIPNSKPYTLHQKFLNSLP
jgi:hypothetical protein